ncbi:MAG: glycosyltransferase [Candidatus Cloacimonetes bacterium]|nr:glycosyltransferase [Candidatus Cloacimonadota bacterium]
MISIVIPYLSGYAELKECLKSIKKQKIKAEIIVVNDSGKDLKLDKVKVINNNETKGAAYSRNIGFKESSSDIVLFVDNDIILKNNCINKLLKKIKEFDIFFPKIVYENGRLMHPISKEERFPQISTCFMIKQDSVKKLDELFDENYRIYLEDADFFLRCNLFSLRSKYINDAVVIHKIKASYNGIRFYLENKNLFYGIIKFFGVNKKNIIHPFHFSSLISNFVCALFNFDKFDWSHYDRSLSKFEKFKLLFRKHKQLIDRNRFILFYYLFKGIFWNLININKILKKKKKLNSYF